MPKKVKLILVSAFVGPILFAYTIGVVSARACTPTATVNVESRDEACRTAMLEAVHRYGERIALPIRATAEDIDTLVETGNVMLRFPFGGDRVNAYIGLHVTPEGLCQIQNYRVYHHRSGDHRFTRNRPKVTVPDCRCTE